jgi:hypothetical protein
MFIFDDELIKERTRPNVKDEDPVALFSCRQLVGSAYDGSSWSKFVSACCRVFGSSYTQPAPQ